MKKVLLSLLVAVGIAQAGTILGADVSHSKVNGDVSASFMGMNDSMTYKDNMQALTVKAGYEFEAVRLLGYYSLENYNENGNARSYGLEADYIVDGGDQMDLVLGLTLGKGELDADGLNLGFKDISGRVAVLKELNKDLELEAGVKYNYREFDDLNVNGVLLEGNEKQIGVYLGLNFTL